MKNYKELIRQLRECGDNCDNCPHYPHENCMSALMEEAADAIEELTKESLSEDGTLFVETDYDIAKIGRVHVRKRGTHAGGMFYDDKPSIWMPLPDEPEVDWTKVPIDTKILVKNNRDKEWKKRYFAGAKSDGVPLAFDGGATSWSVDRNYYKARWDCVKLEEENE